MSTAYVAVFDCERSELLRYMLDMYLECSIDMDIAINNPSLKGKNRVKEVLETLECSLLKWWFPYNKANTGASCGFQEYHL